MHYTQNYAGIIGWSLLNKTDKIVNLFSKIVGSSTSTEPLGYETATDTWLCFRKYMRENVKKYACP